MGFFRKRPTKQHDAEFIKPISVRDDDKYSVAIKQLVAAQATNNPQQALAHNTSALLHLIGYFNWTGKERILHSVNTLNALSQLSKDEIIKLVDRVSVGSINPDQFIETINLNSRTLNYLHGFPKNVVDREEFKTLNSEEQTEVKKMMTEISDLLSQVEDSVKEISDKLGYGRVLRR